MLINLTSNGFKYWQYNIIADMTLKSSRPWIIPNGVFFFKYEQPYHLNSCTCNYEFNIELTFTTDMCAIYIQVHQNTEYIL